ncbi:DNA polymerase kappa-like isoform X2 [Dreissena polymorpha]|uniref:DNA polymerase kappa-like isoform X2 n=1 Tax=Dreissena polymorpha TaxID=45954 RepID=UPI0022650646|nr:DNA polymerase kappa-like isoform X2 [Dreissena polymorpha]
MGENSADDWEDQEDWSDTTWAEPQTHNKSSVQAPLQRTPMAEALSALKSLSKTKEQFSKDVKVHQDPGEANGAMVQRMLLNDNKAGMQGLDKERINQIIYKASKGSKFYENERQKEDQMKRRIADQKEKIDQISAEKLKEGEMEADCLLEDFEQQRDLSHTIVHVDMDAFYAAVEMLDNPELRNKPMAVGSNSMLSTSNYHARKFGVRAAMPGFIGRKLCPDLVIVPCNFEKYTSMSNLVKAIITDYDPNFCPMSLDEAYLDITEHLEKRKAMPEIERTLIFRNSAYVDSKTHCHCDLNEIQRKYENECFSLLKTRQLLTDEKTNLECDKEKLNDDNVGSCESETNLTVTRCHEQDMEGEITKNCPECKKQFPPFDFKTFGMSDEEAVNEMRLRIEQKTRLTASAGIAPNMMLAKVCSDKNKPNGQYKIPATRDAVLAFVKDLPTRKISGIGKVSEAMLNAVGVFTCTDLYTHRGLLYHLYSPISFNYFMRICLGIGSTTVERDSERKSISTERTFSEINKPTELYKKCEELCQCLSEDLKAEQLKGRTVSIKIKTVKFEVRTRAHTLRDYTNEVADIMKSAHDLLRTEIQNCAPQPLRLRLMGVRMSSLLNEQHCKEQKKNTILGAFKRQAELASTISLSEEFSKDIPCPQAAVKGIQTTFEPMANSNTSDMFLKFASSKKEEGFSQSCSDYEMVAKHRTDVSKHDQHSMKTTSKQNTTNLNRVVDDVELDSSDYKVVNDQSKTLQNDEQMHIVDMTKVERSTRRGVFHTPRSSRKRRKTEPESERYECPVCAKTVICKGLNQFNEHVDACLKGDGNAINLDKGCCSNSDDMNIKDDINASCENYQKKVRILQADDKQMTTLKCALIENALAVIDESDTDCAENALPAVSCLNRVIEETHQHAIEKHTKEEDICSSVKTEVSQTFDQISREANELNVCIKIKKPNSTGMLVDLMEVRESANEETGNDSLLNGIILPSSVYEDTNPIEDEDFIETRTYQNRHMSKHIGKDFDNIGHASMLHSRDIVNKEYDIDKYNNCADGNNLSGNIANKTQCKDQGFCGNNRVFKTCTMSTKLNLENKEDPYYDESRPSTSEQDYNKSETMTLVEGFNNDSKNADKVMKADDMLTNAHFTTIVESCAFLDNHLQPSTSGMKYTDKVTKGDRIHVHETENRNQLVGTVSSEDGERDSSEIDGMHRGGLLNIDKTSCETYDEDITSSQRSLLVCPVCCMEQRSASLDDFNGHVDQCLSRGAISDILKEQRAEEKSKHKRCLPHSNTPGRNPPSKKRKTVMPSNKLPCRSIKSFLQK